MHNLPQLIKESGFEYVNQMINDIFFPLPDVIEETGGEIIKVNKKIKHVDIMKDIDDNNLRPANVYELILWRQRNIQTMKKNVWIFAPQQKGKLFDGDIERIPFISNEINIHTLSLGFGDSDFNGKEYILCFNK